MSEYLLPSNENLSISGKRKMFEIINNMVQEIASNFPGKNKEIKCQCGDIENQEHVYSWKIESDNVKTPYRTMFTGNIKHQIEVLKEFEECLRIKESITKGKMSNLLPFTDVYNAC